MYSGKTISVGTILWKVLRNPLCVDLSYEQAAEFAIEYLGLIGASLSYIDKVSDPITINNYKAASPNDLASVRGVKYIHSNDFNNITVPYFDYFKNYGLAMRYASDIYHNEQDNCTSELTYTLSNCVINTSTKDGCIIISYKGIPTDEFGYPLIPDNDSYKMGLEYYILHRYLEPLWMMGKISDKAFQYIQQERYFYAGQASSSMIVTNMDQLQTMMNSINRMIIDVDPQKSFYKNFGQKEIIKRHH